MLLEGRQRSEEEPSKWHCERDGLDAAPVCSSRAAAASKVQAKLAKVQRVESSVQSF